MTVHEICELISTAASRRDNVIGSGWAAVHDFG